MRRLALLSLALCAAPSAAAEPTLTTQFDAAFAAHLECLGQFPPSRLAEMYLALGLRREADE